MPESIVHEFTRVAARTPEAPALDWRGACWTYGDLRVAIGCAAAAIAPRLPGRGARVALLLRNSPQFVALYYGVLAAGGAVVPLNAQERAVVLARQLEHCGATLLVGDPEHPEWQVLCDTLAGRDLDILPVALQGGAAALTRFHADLGAVEPAAEFAACAPGDLAAIIYTSGTTGAPKGVMLSHGNLASNTASIISYLELTPADRGLCVLPFHFSYGNSVLHTHLLSGALLVLEDNFAFPQLILQRMQDAAITGFAGVPSTFALLLGRCRLEEFRLDRLRYVTQAGGAMARRLIERLHAALPRCSLFIMYGQTEATARLTYLPPEHLESHAGSVGVAIPGVEIEVRAEGRRVAAGLGGEIHARGPNVMLGYWNDARATAEVLQDGWLRTGDLGHCDADGFLYIDGRAVEMIKVGAYRVSPLEIEEVIAALAGVVEVGVTGIADEMLGQAIKAVVVQHDGAGLDVRAVKAHCRKQLATYKVPKIVEFTAMLPHTSSGKIQRLKLA